MTPKEIEILSSFESVAKSLKSKPISKGYWEKEKVIIENIVKESKREISSITMSSRKFHKSFSL